MTRPRLEFDLLELQQELFILPSAITQNVGAHPYPQLIDDMEFTLGNRLLLLRLLYLMQVIHPSLLVYNEVCHALSQCWPHNIYPASTKFMTKSWKQLAKYFHMYVEYFLNALSKLVKVSYDRTPILQPPKLPCFAASRCNAFASDFVQALTIQVWLLVSWPRSCLSFEGKPSFGRLVLTAPSNQHGSPCQILNR